MAEPLHDPHWELTRVVVATLRADEPLQGLLFGTRAQIDDTDLRIYREAAELPKTAIREVLPRILVGISDAPFDVEQDDSATPMATAIVTVHTFVEAEHYELGEHIGTRLRVILGSTPLSDSRIIAAGLVPLGTRDPVREPAFRNAWRFTRQYRTAHIGVLS